MTELRPDDHARLRRTFQHMDDLAPPAPSLDSLTSVPKARRHRSRRLTSALAGAAVVLVTVGIVVVAQGPRSTQVSDYEASVAQSNSQDDAIVFLDLDISSDQLAEVGQVLQTLEGVQSFYYVDRDQALAEFKEAAADTPSAIEDIDPNMLPTQYRLALTDSADVATIVSDLEHLPGVRKVILSPSVQAKSTNTAALSTTTEASQCEDASWVVASFAGRLPEGILLEQSQMVPSQDPGLESWYFISARVVGGTFDGEVATWAFPELNPSAGTSGLPTNVADLAVPANDAASALCFGMTSLIPADYGVDDWIQLDGALASQQCLTTATQ